MKRVLLTWYGITDLRSALDFERGGDGPILGALKTGAFSNVVILGCTFADRIDAVADVDGQRFREELASVEKSDLKNMSDFVSVFANTTLAHEFYLKWLKARIAELGITIEIVFSQVNLKKLNDTEGIYEAANRALAVVNRTFPDSIVSLFISPGTPVMAFTWALAALNFPRLKKRLISSSQPGIGPESVKLPSEWLAWNGKLSALIKEEIPKYDICFHLFGEQRMPGYWCVKKYECKRHVFLTSPGYHPECLKPFLGGSEFDVLYVPPCDPEAMRILLLRYIDKLPSNARLLFNLTGGTKLMYAGALAACRRINGTPVYFNSQSAAVINLVTFQQEPIKPIFNIERFFEVNGPDLKIANAGRWEDVPDISLPRRNDLTYLLNTRASQLSRNYPAMQDKSDVKKHRDRVTREGFVPFNQAWPGGSVEIDVTASVRVTIDGRPFSFSHFPEFAKYITGGWFEEFVYLELKPLEEKGLIHDLRIGFEVALAAPPVGSPGADDKLYQEIDVAFTDGYRLYIIECKAGQVKSEHIEKLESLVRKYGGMGGRGILVSRFQPHDEVVKKKIEDSKECRHVCDRRIANVIERMIFDDQRQYISAATLAQTRAAGGS